MAPEHFEILAEERSMECALCAIVPKIIGEKTFSIYSHRGKRDLLSSLPSRLRGYSRSLSSLSSWRIVVVIDRDNDGCKELKTQIETMAQDARLRTRDDHCGPTQIIVRIAIEELEAWYFGDWQAVQAAYPRAKIRPNNCRDPDAIKGGTWEAFERSMKKFGYFASGLRKIEAATKIASHMDPERNTSPSFKALRRALLSSIERK